MTKEEKIVILLLGRRVYISIRKYIDNACVDFNCDVSPHCLRGGRHMSEIKLKENESLDNALKRFKRQCAKSGVMSELRKREHYDKPSVRRKKKSEAARKRKFR